MPKLKFVKSGLTEEERKRSLKEKMEALEVKGGEEAAVMKAVKEGYQYIDLQDYPVDQEILTLLPREQASGRGAVCFYLEDNQARVGMVAPEIDEDRMAVEKILSDQGYSVRVFTISEKSFERVLKLYDKIVEVEERGKVGLSEEELLEAQEEARNLGDLRAMIKKVSASKLIETILAGAVVAEASDIHLEPEENRVVLRYRIDGVLKEVTDIPQEAYERIVSRIKLLAGLKINVRDIPQDGRITIAMKNRELDLRISILPTAFGETIVIRLLGVGAVKLKLSDLGFREEQYEILKEEIDKPNGMILTTGPTGSGKTTTLYSCLNEVKSPEKKIITLENPIEYRLEGISQTQIQPDKGLTFAAGLRSVLRQDPDIVMVGEIRDLETAEIAAQASLTGHLVFSTLHTNDSAGVIPRLVNMGVRPFTLAPALNAVIAQRLVRRLCEDCRKPVKPGTSQIKMFKEKLGKNFPKTGIKVIYDPVGCPKCNETGFRGRIGIYEIFSNSSAIEKLINERASSQEIFETAIKEGMLTMEQDGYLKVIEGITSLGEIERVT